MKTEYCIQVRVTGVLIEDNEILIVKQNISDNRSWSLPGGRLEQGESIDLCITREMKEETGLDVAVQKLLYICETNPSTLHITLLLKKIGGEIRLPTNEFDENPIYDVKMARIADLKDYDFTAKFIELAKYNFPGSGSYMGSKKNIGL